MSERRPAVPANPCLDCGACCASYRVSFYWAEADAAGLPEHLTEQVNPWFGCMAGTQQPSPRCAALRGAIGGEVACSVYAMRPSPCRELEAGDEKCRRARARHGLAPLAALPAAA
ncbi:YkgJ family cysteine cluster protein [Caldimonas tepidiphila]|uniref:YkgJ family cysteine cluster protein n=1 Tax=Caldimonas tepidiphila TaxID=2315841 RepID=UPI000E5B6FCD|nr:YkgJ family cysteine cluster protein [Caldimonas tepidiphila]